MQAIHTEFIGPTNTRGARIKATIAKAVSITVPYDHALNSSDNYAVAAMALVRKMGWTRYHPQTGALQNRYVGAWARGDFNGDSVFVFCFGALADSNFDLYDHTFHEPPRIRP